MSRRESALFLYNYLIKNPEVRVLNINSAWGTGKTFFLERWHQALQRDHVCVTFNAWRNDFAVEPLIALAEAIKNQLGDDSPEVQTQMQDFLRCTASTIKAASPVVIKGLLSKLGGLDSDALSAESAHSTSADAAEKALQHLLAEQRPAEQTIEAFRLALQGVFDDYKQRNPELLDDVFIIIDELDRCRPAFAIEMLERIKHFFDLENCRFVIASDSEQLAHSIKTVYGNDFDATTYIRRFFDLGFNLPEPDYPTFIANNLPELGDGLGYLGIAPHDRRPEVVFLEAMANAFAISLRDLQRCLKRISACHASLPLCFLPMTSGLIFCMETRPAEYRKYGPRGLLANLHKLGINDAPVTSQPGQPTAIGTFSVFIQHMDMSQDELQLAIQSLSPASAPVTREILRAIWNNLPQFQNCQKAVEMATHIE